MLLLLLFLLEEEIVRAKEVTKDLFRWLNVVFVSFWFFAYVFFFCCSLGSLICPASILVCVVHRDWIDSIGIARVFLSFTQSHIFFLYSVLLVGCCVFIFSKFCSLIDLETRGINPWFSDFVRGSWMICFVQWCWKRVYIQENKEKKTPTTTPESIKEYRL